MKILYAIQGTGNGHLSRARDIIPVLMRKGEVDILVSGTEADVELPYPIKYRFKGLCFVFGKKGGIDLFATYRKGNLKRLYEEIKSLPVDNYDIVLNDFEPVSAWACKIIGKACIGLSHQAAVINKKAPVPRQVDPLGKAILKHYAPVTQKYGFHFASYDKNIFTPVIRGGIRRALTRKNDHYTVYLPAYDDKRILKVLKEIKQVEWQVFSKHTTKRYREKNISIQPVANESFLESLLGCSGVLCGAGFETPAEALFLEKKLMVIPMKGQYEQQCNAAALKKMGVKVLKNLKLKRVKDIQAWVRSSAKLAVQYPDITEGIIDKVISEHVPTSAGSNAAIMGEHPYSAKRLREISLQKIIDQISG